MCDRVAYVVIDAADSSDIVATGEIARARQTLLRLADIVVEAGAEGVVSARFGDDEVYVTLPRVSTEDAY